MSEPAPPPPTAPTGIDAPPAIATPHAARRRWPRRLRDGAELAFMLGAFATLLLWCSVPNTERLATENPTSTAFIDLRHDEADDAGKNFDLKWQWRPLGKISRYLRAAVVYAEDYNFYTHEGVDWDAIEKALEKNG